MNKTTTVFFVVLIIFLVSLSPLTVLDVKAQTENTWTTLAPMQEDREDLGVATVDGKIYAICGQDYGTSNTVEEYNPQTDTWTYKKPAPVSMRLFGIAVHHGKIYCITDEGSYYAYTPLYDSWEQKAPLPNPRVGIRANTVNDKIYIVGGSTNSLDIYDPLTDSWTTKTPVPYGFGSSFGWSCTTAVLDGRIHVIGAFPLEYSHQIYDPQNDSWKLGRPLIKTYYHSFAVATTGVNSPKRIYVFGADRGDWHLDIPTPTGQYYDPKTVTWTLIENVPTGHIRGDGATIDDKVYLVGGSDVMIGGANFLARSQNTLYTQIGFGTPDYTYIPLDSTPAPTLSPTPTPTPTQSPTYPSTVPPEPFPTEIILGTIAILVIVGILVYFKKRKS